MGHGRSLGGEVARLPRAGPAAVSWGWYFPEGRRVKPHHLHGRRPAGRRRAGPGQRILSGDIRPDDYLPTTPEVKRLTDRELEYARARSATVGITELEPEVERRQLHLNLLLVHCKNQHIAYIEDTTGIVVVIPAWTRSARCSASCRRSCGPERCPWTIPTTTSSSCNPPPCRSFTVPFQVQVADLDPNGPIRRLVSARLMASVELASGRWHRHAFSFVPRHRGDLYHDERHLARAIGIPLPADTSSRRDNHRRRPAFRAGPRRRTPRSLPTTAGSTVPPLLRLRRGHSAASPGVRTERLPRRIPGRVRWPPRPGAPFGRILFETG